MSVIRKIITFDAAAIIARACTGAKSPAKAASIDQFPTPGQAKTISIITAVPIKSLSLIHIWTLPTKA